MNNKEPRAPKGTPPMPKGLSPIAKRVWPAVAKLLRNMGVLTVADGIALEVLCEAYADWRSSRDELGEAVMIEGKESLMELAESGKRTYITVGKAGPMIRNRPELAAIADAERRLQTALSNFGLTPAARSRIQAADATQKADEEEKFFS